MRQSITDKDSYEKRCGICALGRLSPDGESVLCPKKGITDVNGVCRRYKYDPLKRVPRKEAQLPSYNKEDFEL